MKKITTLLAAIVVCLATTVTASAQIENTLPKEFYGCTLDMTTNLEAKSILVSHGFVPGDYGQDYYITDPKFDDIKYDLALFEFTPYDQACSKFSCITFLKSDLSKKNAIKFAKKVHAKLDKRYTLIKKTVDGLDCYFTSSDGRTLTLLVGKNLDDDKYQVSLAVELGTPKLK